MTEKKILKQIKEAKIRMQYENDIEQGDSETEILFLISELKFIRGQWSNRQMFWTKQNTTV